MICFSTRNPKRRVCLFFLLCSVLISCRKNEDAAVVILSGTYTGTFERMAGSGSTAAQVALSFFQQSWSGESEVDHYPALCHGAYAVKGDQLNVSNQCTWTTDFDWSLILSGNYNLTQTSDTLLIWRAYDNDRKDIYKLVKK